MPTDTNARLEGRSIIETASTCIESDATVLDDETVARLREAARAQIAHLSSDQQASALESLEETLAAMRGKSLAALPPASIAVSLGVLASSGEHIHDAVMKLGRQLDAQGGGGVPCFMAGEAGGMVAAAVAALKKAKLTLGYLVRIIEEESASAEEPSPAAKA